LPYFEQPGRYSKMDREKIPREDFGDPENRKFPIVTPTDVEDAARLVGHAANPEEVKKRIVAIARRKGREFVARLPDSWKEEFKLAEGPAGSLKIPFFRLGKWRHPVYGPIEGTQAKFDAIKENFRRNVLGRPPFVRLGHAKESAPTFGDAPAEAWVHDIIQEGDVLYALAHPTSDGIVDAVRKKKFRFASPEYVEDYMDKETGAKAGPTLMAIALTNEPFLTRLPETVVLADPPETIYLDYEEVKEPMENDILKKLSEAVTRFFEGLKPAPAASGLTDEERKKLAKIDELEAQLSEAKVKLALAESQVSSVASESWKNQVETRLAGLVAKGIPPAMCEQAKAILLASPAAATNTIKLADGKEISLAEQVFAMLEAMPEANRIKLAQIGAQASSKPGAVTAKEVYGDVVPELAGGK